MATQPQQRPGVEDLSRRPLDSPAGRPAHPGTDRISFGPRLRRVVRFVARLVNPLVLVIAGRRWMPIVGIARHRGFRTGRMYSTPVGARPLDGGFVLPLTFGEAAGWYRNIRAAGWCVITWGGVDHILVEPEIVDGSRARSAFPRYERLLLRLIGIDEFLRLRHAPHGWVEP